MRVTRGLGGARLIGVGLLLAAALAVAGLWFYPVAAGDHGGGSVPKCTPIVEYYQYNDQEEWRWSDLCYFPARRRVGIGALGGLLLGGTGLVLLVTGWRTSGDRKRPLAGEHRTSASSDL